MLLLGLVGSVFSFISFKEFADVQPLESRKTSTIARSELPIGIDASKAWTKDRLIRHSDLPVSPTSPSGALPRGGEDDPPGGGKGP